MVKIKTNKKVNTNFNDGITSLNNQLVNRRNILFNTRLQNYKLSLTELQQAYNMGIISKIIRLKTAPLLDNTLIFNAEDNKQELFYESKIAPKLKECLKFMLGFGRGVITLHYYGDDLAKPFVFRNLEDLAIRAFSGDMITTPVVDLNLNSESYLKPVSYNIRGYPIHPSRIIDFTYVKPTEYLAPTYYYGGISETELIYNQILNNSIIERATANIIEKSSNFVYMIQGFKETLRMNNESRLIKYLTHIEDLRQTQGAIVVDTLDDVKEVKQTLSNLEESDTIAKRSIALVTGIPVSVLIGENVKGLNSSGENEIKFYYDMLKGLQHDYVKDPLNELFLKLNFNPIKFKDNCWQTPNDKVLYEQRVLDNALKLQQLGEDFGKYLKDNDMNQSDPWDSYWQEDKDTNIKDDKNFIKRIFSKFK